MRLALNTMAAFWLAMPALAMEQITPEQFLDRAAGRTITYSDEPSGGYSAAEQFFDRDRVLFLDEAGECHFGRVFASGPQLCFVYEYDENLRYCWLVFEDKGDLLIGSLGSMSVYRITEISDRPITCEPAPLS